MNSRPNMQRMPTRSPLRAVTTAQLRPTDSTGQIRRFDDVRLALEHVVNLAAAVDVIAQRDSVDAGSDQLAVNRRVQARAAGGIFRVGDDQIEPFFAYDAGDRVL